jgi:hypothetical protein
MLMSSFTNFYFEKFAKIIAILQGMNFIFESMEKSI